jgi:hypothetical protein
MKYTRKQRAEMSQLFREAAALLATGRRKFDERPHGLCAALTDATVHRLKSEAQAGSIQGTWTIRDRCRAEVMARIYPMGFVTGWLSVRGYLDNVPVDRRMQQVQAYRKRWCLALAEEFSK